MNWITDQMHQNAITAVRHGMYASDAIDYLYGSAEDEAGRNWVNDHDFELTKWFVNHGLEK